MASTDRVTSSMGVTFVTQDPNASLSVGLALPDPAGDRRMEETSKGWLWGSERTFPPQPQNHEDTDMRIKQTETRMSLDHGKRALE